jgi:hypothetical protein
MCPCFVGYHGYYAPAFFFWRSHYDIDKGVSLFDMDFIYRAYRI